jgi:trimeric autotransporter adhesin
MIEYKQNVSKIVPVRVFNSSGNPVSGVTFGQVTAAVEKSDGTVSIVTVGIGDWEEITTGAFAAAGVYSLLLPSTAFSQTGLLTYAVATGSNKTYVGAVKIISNEESETFSRIGAPVGASISDDIASVQSTSTSTSTNVSTINTKIGTPVGTVSTDIAGVQSTTNTLTTNLSTANTNISTINTKIGTPVSTVSADVASVQSTVNTIDTNVSDVEGVVGTINSKIGTPVSTVSADILAVNDKLGTPLNGTVSTDIATAISDISDVAVIAHRIQVLKEGKWKIFTSGPDENRLVLYEADGTTVAQKWELKNSAGALSSSEVYERTPLLSIP